MQRTQQRSSVCFRCRVAIAVVKGGVVRLVRPLPKQRIGGLRSHKQRSHHHPYESFRFHMSLTYRWRHHYHTNTNWYIGKHKEGHAERHRDHLAGVWMDQRVANWAQPPTNVRLGNKEKPLCTKPQLHRRVGRRSLLLRAFHRSAFVTPGARLPFRKDSSRAFARSRRSFDTNTRLQIPYKRGATQSETRTQRDAG